MILRKLQRFDIRKLVHLEDVKYYSKQWINEPPPAISRRRVVITGAGVISPLGNAVEEFWNGLITSKSGITNLLPNEAQQETLTQEQREEQFPFEKQFSKDFLNKCGTSIGAVVKQKVPVDRRDIRELPRFMAFSQAATQQALAQAKYSEQSWDPESVVRKTQLEKSFIRNLFLTQRKLLIGCCNGNRNW
jgi:hypothetical protein